MHQRAQDRILESCNRLLLHEENYPQKSPESQRADLKRGFKAPSSQDTQPKLPDSGDIRHHEEEEGILSQ
jgi:hypothetical protein